MIQSTYFANKPLQPVRGPEHLIGITMSSNLSLAAGQVLAQITASSASCVQTLTTSGSPSSGAFQLNFNGQLTSPLAYNATAAQVQAALQLLPNIGLGGATCTGGALPTAIVITFTGNLASLPEPLIAVVGSTLNTGSASVAMTTAGVGQKRWVAYNGAKVAAPASAPTLAGNGSGSSFAAGSFAVAYTYVTAAGESTPSPAAFVTLTAAQNIQVGALTGLNSAVTAINVYVDGFYAGQISVSSNATVATNISGSSITVGQTPPQVNGAYVNSDGSQVARAINKWQMATDEQGRVILGSVTTPQWAADPKGAEAFFGGVFVGGGLLGLDANAMTQLGGRLLRGTGLSDVNAEILIPAV